MPNIDKILKEEIQRLARKEVKSAIADLKKSNASLKRTAADHKRRLARLERDSKLLQKQTEKGAFKPNQVEVDKSRITAKMIQSIRKRLGISREDFGSLVGASPQSVYLWENKEGRLTFRGDTKARIVALRGMRKADAWKQLDEMEG